MTCDSGHVGRVLTDRVRLSGKRAYAILRQRVQPIGYIGDCLVSGEWEKGLTVA
jgi:hypothetical protein